MKHYHKLVFLSVLLYGTLTLSACGSASDSSDSLSVENNLQSNELAGASASEEDAQGEGIVGIWYLECDLGSQLSEQFGYEIRFSVGYTATFEADGHVALQLDDTVFEASVKDLEEQLTQICIQQMQDSLLERGYDEEAAEEYMQELFSCSVEEYCIAKVAEQKIPQKLEARFADTKLLKGFYKTEAEKLFLSEDGNFEKYHYYVINGDTLTLTVGDGTELIPGSGSIFTMIRK